MDHRTSMTDIPAPVASKQKAQSATTPAQHCIGTVRHSVSCSGDVSKEQLLSKSSNDRVASEVHHLACLVWYAVSHN